MSVRKRGNKWVAQAYDPSTRSKIWVGTFATKAEAREAEHRAWKDAKRSKGRHSTVDAFAERWMDDYPRQRESTVINYRYKAKAIQAAFPGRDFRSIDRVEARAWTLANRSHLQAIRAMFSDAVRDGLCDSNPFTELRLEGSRGRRDLIVPTEEELGKLALEAGRLHGEWGQRVLRNFILLGAYSGLRPGELYGLRWEDLDLHNNTLKVERQFNQATRTFTEPKNGSRRTIFLTPQAKEATQATPQQRQEVFSGPRGGILAGPLISTYWSPVVRSVGKPEFTPHCLRHFYGTLLAAKGLHPADMAKELGHQDGGKLALYRYCHAQERDANERTARAFGSSVRDLKVISGAGEGA